MNQREALKLALEAMTYADACLKKQLTTKDKHEYAQDLLLEAGTAIREALAQPEQEPVATVESVATVVSESGNQEVTMSWWHEPALPVGTKLYTTPPQRKPLTDVTIWNTYKNLWMFHPAEEPRLAGDVLKFARAIEAKLKEKNT